jgi:succinoglycan biosynthesis protein ExoA
MTLPALPVVSIVLPIRNEADYIERTLAAVARQDYPAERMELIVVDGMSTDATRSLIETIRTRMAIPVALLENRRMIFPTGFNIGASRAGGDVVVMLGGHAELAPDFISRCIAHLREGAWDCVGGVLDTVAHSYIGRAVSIAMNSPFGVGNSSFRTGLRSAKEVDTLAFGAYTRSIIDRAGYLDEELVRNQDDEYNYRIRKMGGRILLDPDISVTYYSRGTLGRLWKQYFQYGYWKVRVLQKHPRQMQWRQFVPSVFVSGLIGALALSAAIGAGWPIASAASVYGFANLLATVVACRRNGWMFLPLLPVTFAILHLSYGSGFLAGLFRFVARWKDSEGMVPSQGAGGLGEEAG